MICHCTALLNGVHMVVVGVGLVTIINYLRTQPASRIFMRIIGVLKPDDEKVMLAPGLWATRPWGAERYILGCIKQSVFAVPVDVIAECIRLANIQATTPGNPVQENLSSLVKAMEAMLIAPIAHKRYRYAFAIPAHPLSIDDLKEPLRTITRLATTHAHGYSGLPDDEKARAIVFTLDQANNRVNDSKNVE